MGLRTCTSTLLALSGHSRRGTVQPGGRQDNTAGLWEQVLVGEEQGVGTPEGRGQGATKISAGVSQGGTGQSGLRQLLASRRGTRSEQIGV